MSNDKITRRGFLAGATAAAFASGCATMGRTGKAPGKISSRSPNGKLNIAGIGVGGKGQSDVKFCDTDNIVGLCDVDDISLAKAAEAYPAAKTFKDYRKMLDSMKDIEAVTVSTPDHMHAPIALYAMALGKHVYVQKPLTHSVAEARLLRDAARKHKVVTQMGNQGHSCDGVRTLCEMIWSGAVGQIQEVHAWTSRPSWPQGIPNPLPEQPVPATLDWDLWLGVAPHRPYNAGYAPFNWRGWWDFGCGALGDMACHILDAANWSLHLHESAPTRIEVVRQVGFNTQTGPTLSTLKYEFPARGNMKPVTLYWYEGSTDPTHSDETQNLPPRPEGVAADVKLGGGGNGSYFVGEKGILTIDTYGKTPRFLAGEAMKDYKMPPQKLPRIKFGDNSDVDYHHHQDWIRACKGGPAACSNFDYAAPFTEYVVLGNLALRANHTIEWDSKAMKVTNYPEANQWVHAQYPAGWSS